MAYGDVAWHSENPFPGTLYNGNDGVDYWAGCELDYMMQDVTKDNFIAVLTGDEDALKLRENSNSTRKVLKSNEDSTVFVFFSDHGAPGHLILPTEALYADEIHTVIETMHDKGLYNELALFIEACESGSIFADYDLSQFRAWAMTATDAIHPSYGTYCHPHDEVNGEHLYTCLGDLFSVSWMEYIENHVSSLDSLSL